MKIKTNSESGGGSVDEEDSTRKTKKEWLKRLMENLEH